MAYLQAGPGAAAHVAAYVEYSRIVGDADGGVMFTPSEYEAYKRRVLPARLKNRVYVSWGPKDGSMDCKLIGPETKCFCGHRFKQHHHDHEGDLASGKAAKLGCHVRGCRCRRYHYVPILPGNRSVRCGCKHLCDEHDTRPPYKCTRGSCACKGFQSPYRCDCGRPSSEHRTWYETKAERQERGMPVDEVGVPFAAMGGLTSFSSLASGVQRQDAQARLEADLAAVHLASDQPEAGSRALAKSPPKARKMTEAEEMAFYEKRYQARQRQRRTAGGPARPGIAVNVANGVPLWLQDLAAVEAPGPPVAAAGRARQRQAGPAAARKKRVARTKDVR